MSSSNSSGEPAVGPVRVRMLRIFGRRPSSSGPTPGHGHSGIVHGGHGGHGGHGRSGHSSHSGQEQTRDDQDSTDSDENTTSPAAIRDRDSPSRDRGPNRRQRNKKQSGGGSAGNSDSHGSSSSGGGSRSTSSGSNSQLTGSSSDSGSSNGDNSPGSSSTMGAALGAALAAGIGMEVGLEAGTSSDSGSGGSSGSDFGGSAQIFQSFLRPLAAFGSSGLTHLSGRSNSCCGEEEVRRAQSSSSTLHKVFHGLSLSTQALAPLSRRSLSSSCISGGRHSEDDEHQRDEPLQQHGQQHHPKHYHYHHHHHHHHHHKHHSLEQGAPGASSGSSSDTNRDGKELKEKDAKRKKAPNRILRSPVTYAYVRGISGLPTQRVPRHRLAALPGSSGSVNIYRKHQQGPSYGPESAWPRNAYNS